MAYEVLNDYQTLVDRQRKMDASYVEGLTRLLKTHAVDITDIIPSTIDRWTGKLCEVDGCECPLVGVESPKMGKVLVCRNIISEMKLASLAHRNLTILCLFCKILRNPNGVVAGALHVTHPIEDPLDDDGNPTVDALGKPALGLKALIRDGRVLMDPDHPNAQIWFDVVTREALETE